MGAEPQGLLAQLRRHRRWIAVGVVVAGLAALSRFATIGLLPPSVTFKPLAQSTASTALSVGVKSSEQLIVPDQYLRNMSPRAATLADMIASPELQAYIGRAAAVPASEIAIDAPLWTDLQRAQQWATGEKRANQIVAERDPYRITLNDNLSAPVVNVIAQAPSTNAAARLADSVGKGLNAYLLKAQTEAGTPLAGRYQVTQVAPVTVNPASRGQLANVGAFTFAAVFALWCGLVLTISSIARDIRTAAASSEVGGALDRSSGMGAGSGERIGASTSME